MTVFARIGRAALVGAFVSVLAACGGSVKEDEAAAAEAAAQQQAAQEAARAEAARQQAARAREEAAAQAALADAATAAGSVFYFDFDSSELSREARAAIDAHIALMLSNRASARLEGHTDERGSRAYNQALGERRANAVRDYMVANGVPAYRLESISYGEENPVAYGSGESNWQQNRRVELK